jgi:signal transduction histidine kinase
MELNKTLLIVDDEEKVVEVLVKTFEDDYDVIPCTSSLAALEMIKKRSVGVILTDERMPQPTGLNFLKQAVLIQPDTVNIILTAYADVNVAIDAINSGLVYRYVVKPWDTEDLLITIRQAFERFNVFNQNRLLNDELIRKNEELEKNLEELKATQLKLIRSEKMALLGQLSASIGHELKNPLSRIKGAVSILRDDRDCDVNEVKELLRIVDNEVMISTKIINDLLDFSRERKAVLKRQSLNAIIEATLSRLAINEQIILEKQLNLHLPVLDLDDGQIQQILINLIMNSIQAMDHGGKLYIQTDVEKDRALLIVKDTGCGMNSEQLNNLFEPLFTTKPKGIGLGMSIVKILVEKHKGVIEVQSRQNIGTKVAISLPIPS